MAPSVTTLRGPAMALQRGGYRTPPRSALFPEAGRAAEWGRRTRARHKSNLTLRKRERIPARLHALSFDYLIPPFRSLSPERLPPPPDTGSAAALPPERVSCIDTQATVLHTPRSPHRVWGGFLSFLGGGSYRIRILLDRDVSCMYPVEYMYPGCILMYLTWILNALFHSKRLHGGVS